MNTRSLRSERKKRKFSNKWILDGYIYSDLPIRKYTQPSDSSGRATKSESSSERCGKVYRTSGHASSRATTEQCATRGLWKGPPDQQMISRSAISYDSEERQPHSWSSVSTAGLSSLDNTESYHGGRINLVSSERAEQEELFVALKDIEPRQHLEPNFSELRSSPLEHTVAKPPTRESQTICSHGVSEATATLWPLPSGDPVLPVDLQAVPYPTDPDVRPPLSQVLQYQHDQGPRLPSFSQLTDGAQHNRATFPELAPKIGEGFEDEEVFGLSTLSQPFAFDPTDLKTPFQPADHGRECNDNSIVRPYGTPVETTEGWRMGLMRFYREGEAETTIWECESCSQCIS